MKRIPALSIRQPNAEQILRGKKKIEYRNMPTNKREPIRFRIANFELRNTTVEVVGCRRVRGEYEWDLAKPVRLKRPIKPKNHPQPAWFYPF